ncbi:MAG: AraC family transcriptional regulator [Solobacterium sp.]|nr:AraC family transcriptional regulator [Solobacterium sp.]
MNDIIYVGKHAITYSVTKHLHKNWELIYCTSGRGELVFQDRILPYAENSVAVIPPLIPHTNVGKNSFTNIHVMLGETTLGYTEPFVITAAENGFLRNAFSAAFYYHSNGGVESAALLPIYGQLIVSTIETTGSGDVKTNYLVRQIADQILKYYPDPNYDLNSYLESLSFSTEYLKRVFKQEMGLTPRQYMTEKRLENAAKNLSMLGVGDGMNISQIAHQCGFSDPLYFSKLFKRKYGVSPKNYKPEEPDPEADSDSTKIFL